ncbi:hypothetical protein CLV78_108109 [Aliiruegeria haliotis]|uniref:YgjP-like metallopeptidase domain-containing protein n=1 Tax=Aliiruegeria haliotis TaxID=1280846 RepID=A0A2T0RKZ3_9RHOB|nr:SprT family zinc-dependent metalloprotease [Aliiruegeria haliotis]PRY21838.1 hypothetical protein CLV78_108109 [Aliiruegeria haliotis]
MSEHVLPGERPIRVVLRRSARARRYSLRVSRLDGRVTLTMPQGASQARGLAFVHEKEGWIRKQLEERPSEVLVELGASLPVDGRPMQIVRGDSTRICEERDVIQISRRVGHVPGAVAGLLKAHARDRLAAASDHYARILGRPYTKLTIRDTRSRWGSCSADGALMYSWRLVLAPPDVLVYVAAHEVAHLAHMNHGPRFWTAVGNLMPGYEERRAWLRENGETLHRYRFTD